MIAFILLTLFHSILNKYPFPTYQDVIIQNEVVADGTNLCAPRYEMIKPILDQIKRPFTVLEIGAAQGYFTFRIAHDFPEASCTMIDEDNFHYSYHGRLLYDLCQLNSHLKNITLIRKHLSIEDLKQLVEKQHFDVVLAFLVIHQMHSHFDQQKEILDLMLKLGDNLLLEVADDASPLLSTYAEHLCKNRNGVFLGSIKRVKDPASSQLGKLYWFKN